MPIRINKVTKEFSIGLQTLVDLLNKKGFTDVEANPNASLSDEQYAVVQAEFNKGQDKGLRMPTPQPVRKTKEKKETIVLTESGEALPLTEVKKPKLVGHINLDSKGNPTTESKPEPEPETKKAPEAKAEPKAEPKPTPEAKVETPQPATEAPAAATEETAKPEPASAQEPAPKKKNNNKKKKKK